MVICKPKKNIYILIVIIVLLTSLVLGFNKYIFKFEQSEKKSGNKFVQNGIIMDQPTAQEKLEVANSIDPISGLPTKEIIPKADKKEVKFKQLKVEDSDIRIDIPYVKEKDKDVIIYDYNADYSILAIPDSDEYLIDYQENIYITDLSSGKIKKYLKDEVLGYKIEDIANFYFEYIGIPSWGHTIEFSPTGKFLLYYTERGMMNGEEDGGIWIKSTETGEEYPTQYKGGYSLGWLDENTAIFDDLNSSIVTLNTINGQVDEVLTIGHAGIAMMGNILLIEPLEENRLITYNFEDNSYGEIVLPEMVNRVASIMPSEGSWVALTYYEDNDVNWPAIALYNLETGIWKNIPVTEGMSYNQVSWYDTSTLIVNTCSTDGNMTEDSYTVNIDEVEELQ